MMPLRDDLLDPIPGPNPAGVDLRYEPIYDEIKEARRHDDDLPREEWDTARKEADYGLVVTLASDALAAKSKDLWIAAWLTEALLRQEGFGGLAAGLDLIQQLIRRFWDHLYPEIDEGDAGFRTAPLSWLGQYLDEAVQSVPLDTQRHGYSEYRAMRSRGGRPDALSLFESAPDAMTALSAREFDAAVAATPLGFYQALVADLDACMESLGSLDMLIRERFWADPPSLLPLRVTLMKVQEVARTLLAARVRVGAGGKQAAESAQETGGMPSRGEETRDGEDVQFTVYRPDALRPGDWYPMLVFVHLTSIPLDAPDDTPHPLEEVEEMARATLREDHDQYGELRQESLYPIPRGGELTLVPEVHGIEFNPPRRTFRRYKRVHQETFDIMASRELEGTTARGRLTVFLGNIIVADVPLALRVTSRGHPGSGSRTPVGSVSAQPYRNVFPSYSHRDQPVVEEFESHAKALGDRYLRDVLELRSGERWDERIASLIERADIFQLFWSTNSMRSPYVQQEYQHALSLRRDFFVRPVYWETPLPEAPDGSQPPTTLRRIHFQRIFPLRPDAIEQSAAGPAGPPNQGVDVTAEEAASPAAGFPSASSAESTGDDAAPASKPSVVESEDTGALVPRPQPASDLESATHRPPASKAGCMVFLVAAVILLVLLF